MMAWDLDNTLIWTREANLRCYLDMSVIPPPNFHQIPWSDWTTQEIHDEKGRRIIDYLCKYAEITPYFDLFVQVRGPVLTAASEPVIRFVRDTWRVFQTTTILRCKTLDRKIAELQAMQPGVYIDDSQEAVERVRRETEWTAALARFSYPQQADRSDSATQG